MMKTVYMSLFAAFVLGFTSVNAQKVKVVDQSAKKQPAWVNGLEKGYVISMASGSSLDEAQQKALTKVKEQIISSVAENVQTSTDYTRGENTVNNISEFFDNIETNTKTQSADVNFLKGISMSQVEEFYWEKIKKGDAISFDYHLKYPFSAIQLMKLVKEFEKADEARTEALNNLIAATETEESLEKIAQLLQELEATEKGFKDYDGRKNKTKVAIEGVKELMRNVSVETVSATLGEIQVMVKSGERMLTTAKKPSVKSNCAKITEVNSKGRVWIICYTYDECYDDPDNAVKVDFKNKYGTASNSYYFNIKADKVELFVNEDIHLQASNTKDVNVSGIKCSLTITAKYASPFVVNQLVLKFGNEAPIIVDNINQRFEGEGKHTLTIDVPGEWNKQFYSAKAYPNVKGSIQFTSVKSNEKFTYKMFNQNITTNW